MPNVSELMARYNNPNGTINNSQVFNKTSEVRKWQKVEMSSELNKDVNSNIPPWKAELLRNKEKKNEEKNNVISNGRSNISKQNGDLGPSLPMQSSLWKEKQSSKPLTSKPLLNDPKSSFKEAKTRENIPQANTTKYSHNEEEGSTRFTLPPARFNNSFLHKRRTSSTSSNSGSVISNPAESAKSEPNQEEFPSGGSFISVESTDHIPVRKPSDGTTAMSRDRPSFLHRPGTNAPDTNAPPDQSRHPSRRRLPLPPHVYKEPPPAKPMRKPINAKLPNPLENGHSSPNAAPMQQVPNGHPQLSSLNAHKSPSRNITGIKHGASFLRERMGSNPLPAPAIPDRHLSSVEDGPPALPERNVPPRSSNSGSTASDRPVLPVPQESSIGQRTLPTVPPLPQRNPSAASISEPPPVPPNDRYPIPPKTHNQTNLPPPIPQEDDSPIEEIPIWEDEDEYDDTVIGNDSEKPPPLPPQLKGSNLPSNVKFDPPNFPQVDDEVEDTYEEAASSNIPPPVPQLTKEDEKKRKELEKKEKEMRKKFKLPLEGEIPVQSGGLIKSDTKLSKKVCVHANEPVDIIRMNDNPKGKWLIRTKSGVYGYVDSANIGMDMNTVRQAMGVAGHTQPTSEPELVDSCVYDTAAGDFEEGNEIYEAI